MGDSYYPIRISTEPPLYTMRFRDTTPLKKSQGSGGQYR